MGMDIRSMNCQCGFTGAIPCTMRSQNKNQITITSKTGSAFHISGANMLSVADAPLLIAALVEKTVARGRCGGGRPSSKYASDTATSLFIRSCWMAKLFAALEYFIEHLAVAASRHSARDDDDRLPPKSNLEMMVLSLGLAAASRSSFPLQTVFNHARRSLKKRFLASLRRGPGQEFFQA